MLELIQTALKEDNLENEKQIRRNEIICYENLLDFAAAKEKMESYLKDFPDDEEAQRENVQSTLPNNKRSIKNFPVKCFATFCTIPALLSIRMLCVISPKIRQTNMKYAGWKGDEIDWPIYNNQDYPWEAEGEGVAKQPKGNGSAAPTAYNPVGTYMRTVNIGGFQHSKSYPGFPDSFPLYNGTPVPL